MSSLLPQSLEWYQALSPCRLGTFEIIVQCGFDLHFRDLGEVEGSLFFRVITQSMERSDFNVQGAAKEHILACIWLRNSVD